MSEVGSRKSGVRGGKRAGAGRKAKEITRLKRVFIKRKEVEAEFALALFVGVMHTESLKLDYRMDAAREVMNRVWGKPNLKVELTETPKLVELDE